MTFAHPECLYFLLAIPFFFLFYGLYRLLRKRKFTKKGLSIPIDKNPKFTISNGWFVVTISSIVYAILVFGLSHPRQTDEYIHQQDSKKLELMLAFETSDLSSQSKISETKLKLSNQLKELKSNNIDLKIGVLAGKDLTLTQTLTNNLENVSDFLVKVPVEKKSSNSSIAEVLDFCHRSVKWNHDNVKHAIVIFSDVKEFSESKIESALEATQKESKKGIFTYMVGIGEDADHEQMEKISKAGKGVYIPTTLDKFDVNKIIDAVKYNKKTTFIDVMNYILLFIFFLLTPSLVIYMCKKYKWMGKIGPIIFLYAVGMLLGNLTINGASLFPDQINFMQDILSTAMVPLAIPLMLYSCTLNKNEIGKHLKAMLIGIVGVVVAVIGGYYICGEHIPEANKVAGMLSGVYTGGTVNLAAIKESVQASKESYILMQTYDIVICLSYLIFLMAGGISLFRKFLPYNNKSLKKKDHEKLSKEEEAECKRLEDELTIEDVGFRSIFTKEGFKNTLILIGVTILGIAICAGITLVLFGGELNMAIFFLLITTFGIIGSFFKGIHNKKQHYNLGIYFIYIFSLVIASMADFDKLVTALTTDYWLPLYMIIAVFGSLFISALLAKLFKLDGDTMVITSVTYINSPAFVPMIAAAMKNRNVLIPGLTIGVIGFAIGTYLGTFIAFIL